MAIDRYDPFFPPDPAEWLALDESERIALVADYHEGEDLDTPSPAAHAGMHVAVENQIAAGDETPVKERARQLMAQGLDRHETIHAIASVLIGHIQYLLRRGEMPEGDANARYYSALKRLNARKWRQSG
ncbi:MAG TPA: DUF1841 family protein [Acetobacteraceae bacterium]|jgi:hypothetical protein